MDRTSGWVDARLDDSELPAAVPESMRKHFSMRSFPPNDVRATKAPVSATATQDHPIRTWTDRSGKFNVQARFQRVDGPTVVLTKEDGKPVAVPLEKLSEQDVSYVRGLSGASDSPFQEMTAPSLVQLKKANWRDVKTIRPQTFPNWTFSPSNADTQSDMNAGTLAHVQMQLADVPDSDAFFEKVAGVYISDDGRRAFVCRTQGSVRQDGDQYVEAIDLVNKASIGMAALPTETALLDVLPDQNLLMFRPEQHGFGNKTVLTLARLEKQQITPIAQWEPYSHENWEPSRDIENAWFLSSERILTINHHGKELTIWDVASATALTNIPVGSAINLKTSLSPDRKLLAVVMKDGVAIIDLVAGRHAATIPTDGLQIQAIAFRADNRQLAGVSDRGLSVWDLTTGQLFREIVHSIIKGNERIAWAGNFVLTNGRYLFDVDRRILLWEYQLNSVGSNESSTYRRGRLCSVQKTPLDQTSMLISMALPHSAALEEAKRLPPADELLVVKPGDAVAIEVDVDPGIAQREEIQQWFNGESKLGDRDEAERANIVVINAGGQEEDMIRRSLASALEAAGLRVVDKSDLVVKAICKKQPSQTVAINADGRWPVRQEDIVQRTITPHASYLEMSLHGDVLWKRGYIARPGHIFFVERDETLDAALERLTRPNLNVFKHAKFSANIARPGAATENGAYGVSRWTPQGLVEGSGSFE